MLKMMVLYWKWWNFAAEGARGAAADKQARGISMKTMMAFALILIDFFIEKSVPLKNYNLPTKQGTSAKDLPVLRVVCPAIQVNCVFKMMDFVFKMTNFALTMMNVALKMMNVALNMMNLV